MSVTFRWIILILLLILNLIAYAQNPKLHSNSKKCFKLNCKITTFIIGMVTTTLSIISLISLWYISPFSSTLIDYWYIPIVIIIYAIIIQITISSKPFIDNGDLNPPPDYLLQKKYRIALYIIILLLIFIHSLHLYIDKGVNLINNSNRYLDHFILGRFGGITKNKYMFFIEWLIIIRLFVGILNITDISNFNPCDYDLPNSWNY